MKKLKLVNWVRLDKLIIYIQTDNPEANLYIFYAFKDGYLQCFAWKECEVSIFYHAEEDFAIDNEGDMHNEIHLKDDRSIINVVLTSKK